MTVSQHQLNIQSKLNQKIFEQVQFYLPTVKIENITFTELDQDLNSLSFQIFYSIPDIGVNDLLEFTI